MARRRGDYYHFPSSTPRIAAGGIKAQSKRGEFAQSWWGKRWIAVLESFRIGARLDRGRSYARRGQVLAIEVEKGRVTAKVQGSRAKPYRVTMKVETLTTADWQRLAKALFHEALFVAKLLAGEMPEDIERAFAEAGLSLFPQRSRDLKTDCSCPDWSNPCKHIAAVYYLLGEEFDRDPFLIFKLRGMSRDRLVDLLGVAEGRAPARGATEEASGETAPAREPLPADREEFWGHAELPDSFFGDVQIPRVPATLTKRLGSFPFWRAREELFDVLDEIYERAAERGMDVFVWP